jgi:hypothetical protein
MEGSGGLAFSRCESSQTNRNTAGAIMAKKSAKREAEKKAKPRREPVYTALTFITFVAMTIGCVLLYLDFDEYGKNPPPKETVPTLPKLGEEK